MIGVALALLLAVPQMDCARFRTNVFGAWMPSELAKTEKGIRLRLEEQQDPRRIADLYFDGSSWRQVIPADAREARQRQFARARARKDQCEAVIPYKQPDAKTAIALRPHLRVADSIEEKPATCDERDGVVWFGLRFYEGEGMDGVGGIGRYDRKTGQIEARRPEWLRDKSVDRIVFDGRDLWLAVTQHYENQDEPWGLARYDWNHDEIVPLRGKDAPCGFQVLDLLLDGRKLWVATDLGLSQLDFSRHTWTHWIAGRDEMPRAAACPAVYERVMKRASELWNCEEAFDTANWTARFAPEIARDSILREPIIHPFEAEAAGTVARNVRELRAIINRTEPVVTAQVMRAYAERKSEDREWRDFAFAYAKRTGDIDPLRYFRGDDEIFQFVVSLAKSGKQRAIEALPWIGGQRAEAPALVILDQAVAKGDRATAIDAIEALERAAHLRIEEDGRTTALAANSDTPEYAEEEFGAFTRYRAEFDELRRIAAQWHQRLKL